MLTPLLPPRNQSNHSRVKEPCSLHSLLREELLQLLAIIRSFGNGLEVFFDVVVGAHCLSFFAGATRNLVFSHPQLN